MKNERHEKYDIIGDIHGHKDKLVGLLHHLGYEFEGGAVAGHPEGRRALFLGDFIDRGPDVRGVLHLVRGMTDSGLALAVMGNHEFNAVAYHTPRPGGGWLRPHNAHNTGNMRETHAAFVGREAEWGGWVEWFKALPMWLDLGGFRAVHACWDPESMAVIGDRDLRDPEFLIAAATEGTPEYGAVETVLKGPEMRLPKGVSFGDRNGVTRHDARVRWWGNMPGDKLTVGDVAMPPGSFDLDHPVDAAELARVPDYPPDAPPVFVGHYWMPPDAPKEPLAPNVVCLDFSAGRDGPLVSYRWDGAGPVTAGRMTSPETSLLPPGVPIEVAVESLEESLGTGLTERLFERALAILKPEETGA